MAKARFLVSTRAKGLEFRVMKVNKETSPPRATLIGATGTEFDIDLTDEALKKYGYSVDVREVPDEAPTVSA